MSEKEPPTKLENILRLIKNNQILVVGILIAMAIIGTSQITNALDSLGKFFERRPTPAELLQANDTLATYVKIENTITKFHKELNSTSSSSSTYQNLSYFSEMKKVAIFITSIFI
jgi:hypothetical protein